MQSPSLELSSAWWHQKISVRPEERLRAKVGVGCADEADAQRLEEQVLTPRRDLPGLTFRRDGAWLAVEWTGELAALRKALGG